MRLRSGDQFPRGFRTDSDRIPNAPESDGIPGMGMGMGREWKPAKAENTPAFTQRKQGDLAWARAMLPGEHPPFITAAMDSLRLAGVEVTPGAVMDRLRYEGKDRASRIRRAE